MAVGMGIKVGSVAGLAACPCNFANRTASQGAIRCAVAGRATKSGMSLADGCIRSGSSGCMATDAESDGYHIVAVAMPVKVGAVTGLAVGASGHANRAANQDSGGGAVAGSTTKAGMGLA